MSLLSFCLATYLYSGLCGLDSWLSVLVLLSCIFYIVFFFGCLFPLYYIGIYILSKSFIPVFWIFLLSIFYQFSIFSFSLVVFCSSNHYLFIWFLHSLVLCFLSRSLSTIHFMHMLSLLSVSCVLLYLSLFSFFRGCRNKDINIFIYLLLLFLLLFIYYFLRYFPNFTVHS